VSKLKAFRDPFEKVKRLKQDLYQKYDLSFAIQFHEKYIY